MTSSLRVLPFVLALLLGTVMPAHASGSGPVDEFVTRSRTEMPLDRYGRGELGLVLTGYSPSMLLPVWRAMAGADAGKAPAPVSEEAIDGACCSLGPYDNGDWDAEKRPAIAAWLQARSAVTPVPPRWRTVRMKRVPNRDYQDFLNCSDDAYRFAAETLGQLRRREDATPARLAQWVETQDAVFGRCGGTNRRREYGAPPAPPPPPLPDVLPLPDSEPPIWRQARGYQQGAAAFYAGDWAAADSRFNAIAGREGHGWQAWAAVAQMRTAMRRASLGPLMGLSRTDDSVVKSMEAMAARIAAHPDWTVQQRAAGQMLEAARAQFEPAAQFDRLTRALAVLDRAPQTQTLIDWRVLADTLDRTEFRRQLRERSGELTAQPLIGWIDTMRSCARQDIPGGPRTVKDPDDAFARPKGFAVAVAQWRKKPSAALWLLPALSCADGEALSRDRALRDALMAAADRLPSTHPGWLTIRWQQVRLLRESGADAQARERLAPLVEGGTPHGPTASARNLIAQEALALARTPDEAFPWLARESGNWNRPRSEIAPLASASASASAPASAPAPASAAASAPPPLKRTLASDGARLISERFALADWQRLVDAPQVPQDLRAQLAFGWWWRAELSGQTAMARTAAERLGALLPKGRSLVAPYLDAKTPTARRSAIWRIALRHPAFSAQLGTGLGGVTGWDPEGQDPKDVTASQWCRLDGTDNAMPGSTDPMLDEERMPPLSTGFPEPAGLMKERATLKSAGTATGEFSRWVLAESRRPDRPADLPWLLYVGIQSTRGGCVDLDNSERSKAMFQTLHRLYPKSEWAKRSPYYF